ncbi:MAG: hypothetical protein AAGA75_26575 [Cyanobacteria bacterium P01_E01_bin.6]
MQRFLCGDRPSFSTMISLTLHHDRPSFLRCRFERLWNSRIVEWKIEAERFHQVLRIGTHMELWAVESKRVGHASQGRTFLSRHDLYEAKNKRGKK